MLIAVLSPSAEVAPAGEAAFMAALQGFHQRRGTPSVQDRFIKHIVLQPWLLWCEVMSYGGHEAVRPPACVPPPRIL